jgi:hypothetical protein
VGGCFFLLQTVLFQPSVRKTSLLRCHCTTTKIRKVTKTGSGQALLGKALKKETLLQETRFLQRSPYTTTKNYLLLHLFDNVL